MGATTRFGLHSPELTDAPNGPSQMAQLASDVDGWLCRAYRCTSSTRPTGVPDEFLIRESDTGNVYIWNGSAWQLISQVVGSGGSGGGGTGAVGTVSTTYMATAAQPIPVGVDTVVAFGVDVATDAAVVKSTSGPGHKFTLQQSRLWTISATLRFVLNGVGSRTFELRAGSTVIAKTGMQASSANAYTTNLCVARKFNAGTDITAIARHDATGASLALETQGGNSVHIDLAGV